MTAQADLRTALRDGLGPALRSKGFMGSAPNWTRMRNRGDLAVVNVQSSAFNTKSEVRCVVNIAVSPEPWLRFQAMRADGAARKTFSETLGLYRDRIAAGPRDSGGEQWFTVTDGASAGALVTAVLAQLDAWGWDLLDRLQTPEGMLEVVRGGDLGTVKAAWEGWDRYFAVAEAVLLMDNGPSDRLDCLLERASAATHEPQDQDVAWIRAQAYAATRSSSEAEG